MSRVGKVENRESVQQEQAVVDSRIAADIDDYFVSAELPFGMRKLAGGDRAVVNEVVVGAGFLDDFSAEGKGRGRGEHGAGSVKAQARCPDYIVEAPGLGGQVIGSVARLDVIVVGTAVESEMSGRGGLTAVGVVCDFIGAEDVGAVMNFGIAVQLVDVADLLLLDGAHGGGIVVLALGLLRTRRI